MPELVRLYIRHVVIGYLLSAVFVALLLWLNVGNLWHLISTSDVGVLAVVLLVLFNGIVFSGVQFGIAVMRMGDDADGGGGRDPAPAPEFAPVAVPVRDV